MGNPLFMESSEDFEKARNRGRMQSLMSSLAWKNSDLLSLYAVTEMIKPKNETYLGMRTIPIANIIGSEGRYHDFSLAFYPKKELLRSRWQSIDRASKDYIILPPISVYKLGDWYFVRDGNHRVSVAKTQGVEFIDAEVVELDTEIPLEPGLTMRQLGKRVVEYERKRFIDQYNPVFLPMDEIVFSSPGSYPEMVNHILVHKYYINQDKEEEISFEEAALSWYNHVYQPIIEEIRQEKILSAFPGKTEADLYMWIVRHWDHLKYTSGSQEVSIASAAMDYKLRFGKSFFKRWVGKLFHLDTKNEEQK
ncbi:transcriptional regulator [uncultured Sphaerochaeta sp.]|uniref:transcriptional regulator n=1 Tax=uncultured Sphaerochaeta sp. TaxID=886478 RepID=UPI002A0A1B49|nr:transcriptional regulator [uncultured Sphaerochaeta sp.]